MILVVNIKMKIKQLLKPVGKLLSRVQLMLEKVENLVIKESPQVLIHLNKVKNALIDFKVHKRHSVQTSITDYFASK